MSVRELGYALHPEEYKKFMDGKHDDLVRRMEEGESEDELYEEIQALRTELAYYRNYILPEKVGELRETARAASEANEPPPQPIMTEEETMEEEEEEEDEPEEEEEEEEYSDSDLEEFARLNPLSEERLKEIREGFDEPDFEATDEDVMNYLRHIVHKTGVRTMAELNALNWERILTDENWEPEPIHPDYTVAELARDAIQIRIADPPMDSTSKKEDSSSTNEDVAHHPELVKETSTDVARDELFIGEEEEASNEEIEDFEFPVSIDESTSVDRHREVFHVEENSFELSVSIDTGKTVSTAERNFTGRIVSTILSSVRINHRVRVPT